MDIGFLGLGHMGRGVARNLMAAGHRVTVWNRSPGPAQELAAEGAVRAADPAEALQGEVAFSMLAKDEAIDEALVASGALSKARAGLVHVNMATVSVAFARRMEAEHERLCLGYVAAPVLGRPDVAAKGALHVICAGLPEPVATVRPLLESFAAQVWPMGDEAHKANVVKIACNFSLAAMIETLGEAGALAESWDVPRADLYALMTGSVFGGRAYTTYSDIIARQAFSPPAFALPLGAKDVRLALAAGEETHTPLPLASLLRDHFTEAMAAGDGDKDWSALAAGAFRRAGRPLG